MQQPLFIKIGDHLIAPAHISYVSSLDRDTICIFVQSLTMPIVLRCTSDEGQAFLAWAEDTRNTIDLVAHCKDQGAAQLS